MTSRHTQAPTPQPRGLAATIAGDFASSLAFAALYALTRNPVASLGAALLIGVLGLVRTRARGEAIERMQWTSLALVVVFGAAALVSHDARFLMLKPTAVYLIVAAAMLKRGWMRRYLPAKAQAHGGALADRFGYVWAAAMAGLALINLGLVIYGDVKLWAACLGTAPLALKLTLGAVQYGVTRRHVVEAVRREREGAGQPGALEWA